MTRRTQQMGEFLREEVTDIIRSELDDPRLGFWTVTRVEVPTDMRSARVYVSVLGSDGERTETLKAQRNKASQEIANRCDIHLDLKTRHFPVFAPPAGKSDVDYLRELVVYWADEFD